MAAKAATTVETVLANAMETPPHKHKRARSASFALLEEASRLLDAALKSAANEVAAIQAKTRCPTVNRDGNTEARQREICERLTLLPEDRRKAIIQQAVNDDDNLLLLAVLGCPAWLSGLSNGDLSMTRHAWANKHFASDLERATRLEKAIDDAQRAGELTLEFVP